MINYYELRIGPDLPAKRPPRRTAGIKWTDEILETLQRKFPTTFNKVLAEELGVGWRTLVRKARELGLEKEDGFLDKNRRAITEMARDARPPNEHKGKKGFVIPGSEKYRFKPGNVPAMAHDRELVERVRQSRNETIREERMRLRMGLEPLTRLGLVNY